MLRSKALVGRTAISDTFFGKDLRKEFFGGRGAMLREVLERIGKSYIVAKEESFKGHPLARFIRKGGPDEVGRAMADSRLIPKGGCGVSGQWAYVPWIGLFDSAITDGAQRGFYIVYLFSADMKRVYLHKSGNDGSSKGAWFRRRDFRRTSVAGCNHARTHVRIPETSKHQRD